MSTKQRLTVTERRYFELLAEIIFSNPFGLERPEVEAMLGEASHVRVTRAEHHYSPVIPALERHLSNLAERGVHRRDDVVEKDRVLLEYAFLFRTYHRYSDELDSLIRNQLAQGDTPAPVPFAAALLRELGQYGFQDDEALRYLALSYQFRRAYFFIAHELVGDSASMRALRRALWNNVFTTDVRLYLTYLWNRMEDFSTLLLGETGTGKGSAAAAIGRSGLIPFDPKSQRFAHSFTATFTAINLSEFPESLIESELFGHRKGAFTGAIDHHQGVFERCSPHGALFLDEIGDVSVPVQIKLLNVIQERRFTPVGSHEPRRFEGRVIAATNQPVEELRRQGRFREDFYYRLSSDVIRVPPLRERLRESPSELSQLVQLLVARLSGEAHPALAERVLEILGKCLPRDYGWPGNVRELEQAVRRILISGSYQPANAASSANEAWLEHTKHGQLSASDLLSEYCAALYARLGTYEEVASRTGLDRRTVKKYITTATTPKQ